MKGRLFNSIFIETSALCNRKCVICPNSIYNKHSKQTLLSMNIIEKILKELKELDYDGIIGLYNYNEPLLDPRLLEIIELIRKTLPGVCISLSTNGDFLTIKKAQELYEAGLNVLGINDYNILKNFKNKWGDFFNNLKKIYPEIEETVHRYRKYSRTKKMFSIYNIQKDMNVVNPRAHYLTNRGGLMKNIAQLSSPIQQKCVRPFRYMIIDFKGNYNLCCEDYLNTVKLGNIADKTILKLWNSFKINSIRKKLFKKNRNFSPCDKCSFKGGEHLYSLNTFWK